MDETRIKHIINKGEGLNIEFKEAAHTLPKSFFETVCAFLNQQGGTILLGVSDNKEPLLNEKDLFEVIIPITTPKTTPKTTPITTPKEGDKLRDIIKDLIIEDPHISASKISKIINMSRDGVRYHLQILKETKQIKFEGKPRTGKWKVLK